MFIILGSPRSGTTLLSSSLDLHTRVRVPDETDFIIPVAFIIDRVKDVGIGRSLVEQLILSSERYSASLGQYLDPEDVHQVIRRAEYSVPALIPALYQRIADKQGVLLAGDKSPNDLEFAAILSRMGFWFGDVKAIHLVRDVRDVVASMIRIGGVPDGAEGRVAYDWRSANLALHYRLRGSPNYLLVRYEDFVSAPAEQLQHVTDFLGLEFEEGMLDHRLRGMRYNGQSRHSNLALPITRDLIGAGRYRLTGFALDRVEQRAGEALGTFGYTS